jgi:hypothetical protein
MKKSTLHRMMVWFVVVSVTLYNTVFTCRVAYAVVVRGGARGRRGRHLPASGLDLVPAAIRRHPGDIRRGRPAEMKTCPADAGSSPDLGAESRGRRRAWYERLCPPPGPLRGLRVFNRMNVIMSLRVAQRRSNFKATEGRLLRVARHDMEAIRE